MAHVSAGTPSSSTARLPAFHVMGKPRGPVCNLHCKYCYYLEKEEMYPQARFRMSDALLEKYVRDYIASQETDEITFAWQGGEPTLMGLDFYRDVVALQRKYTPAHKRVTNSLQTNATRLTEEWCTFFKDNGFLLGISLDGPEDVHDAYRRDNRGLGTWARVMEGLEQVRAHGIEHNLLCTVHAANEAHGARVYRFLRDEAKAGYIQFIPIVERARVKGVPVGGVATEESVSPAGFGIFLCDVFDQWVRRDVGSVFVQHFDVSLARWLGMPAGLCVHDETCGTAMAMEHNGDLYSCDHFVEPEHLLGNITETPIGELASLPRQKAFGVAKRDSLPQECRACRWKFACNGACPKDRFVGAAAEGEKINYLCPSFQTFFAHVDGAMRLMAGLVRRGGSAVGIMDFAKARPNSACPCGSGAKFKKCCAPLLHN